MQQKYETFSSQFLLVVNKKLDFKIQTQHFPKGWKKKSKNEKDNY